MPIREPDGLEYRSPVVRQGNQIPVSRDEEKYDTLRIVFDLLEETTTGLYKDFNVFTINKDKLPFERAKLLLHQVEVNQGIYDVVAPLLERVGNAIAAADDNFRRRQEK